jgi:hypothetical protein
MSKPRNLAGELHRIAAMLDRLGHQVDHEAGEDDAGAALEPPGLQAVLLEEARNEFALRQSRTRFIRSGLLGEPVWDMLVLMFIGTLENRQVTINDACAVALPFKSTARRFLDIMVAEGIVMMRPVGGDSNALLELRPETFSAMTELFSQRSAALANWLAAARDLTRAPDSQN